MKNSDDWVHAHSPPSTKHLNLAPRHIFLFFQLNLKWTGQQHNTTTDIPLNTISAGTFSKYSQSLYDCSNGSTWSLEDCFDRNNKLTALCLPHCYYILISVLSFHTAYTMKIYSHRTRPEFLQMCDVCIHTDILQA